MKRIIDFHAHILPGADHGSNSSEITAWQLEAAVKTGITDIVATPHFYPHEHSVSSFVKRRSFGRQKYEQIAMDNKPRLHIGAEVLLCEGIENLPELDELCLSGTKNILLEMPSHMTPKHYRSIANLIDTGYNVIMAHADRYSPKYVYPALEAGAAVQLNAEGLASIRTRRFCRELIADDTVVAIGSDIHMMGKNYKYFEKAIDILGSNFDRINNSAALMLDEALQLRRDENANRSYAGSKYEQQGF